MDDMNHLLASTTLSLPLPPGDPSGWTTVFDVLGPRCILWRTPHGQDLVDRRVVRALLEAAGRPCRDEESLWLWLVSPIPSRADWVGRLLREPDYWLRYKGSLILGVSGSAGDEASLRPLLGDPDNDVRAAAAWAYGQIGSSVGPLLDALADEDPMVEGARLIAAAALDQGDVEPWLVVAPGVDGELGAVVAGVIDLLRGDPSALCRVLGGAPLPYRQAAAAWLARDARFAFAALDALVAAFEEVRSIIDGAWMLTALAAAGEEAVEAAVRWLSSEDWNLRAGGARVLSAVGGAAAQAEAQLVDALADADADVQREAALALLSAGLRVDATRRFLTRGLTRDTWSRVDQLGVSLGPIDALWERRRPDLGLLGVLHGPVDATVSGVGALLLARSAPDLAGPALRELARDELRRVPLALRVACAAACCLGRIPVDGVIFRLLLAHDGSSPGPAGGGVAGLADRVGELVLVVSHDGDPPVRVSALRLLRQLGPESVRPFAPTLAWIARRDGDAEVRREASAFVTSSFWASGAERLVSWVLPVADSPAAALDLSEACGDVEGRLQIARAFVEADDRAVGAAAASWLTAHAPLEERAAWAGRMVDGLRDPEWERRERAALALATICFDGIERTWLEEAREALEDAAGDADHDVATAARAALAAWGRSWR
jgi:HEAT repeat protein